MYKSITVFHHYQTDDYFFSTDHCQDVDEAYVPVTVYNIEKEAYVDMYCYNHSKEIPNPDPKCQA